MSKPKPKPIRLTKQRADALLAVFETGAADREEALRDGAKQAAAGLLSAPEAAAWKERDLELARARDAAAIVRARYLGGEVPTTPTPTLFD